jgi:hypothetical protein
VTPASPLSWGDDEYPRALDGEPSEQEIADFTAYCKAMRESGEKTYTHEEVMREFLGEMAPPQGE